LKVGFDIMAVTIKDIAKELNISFASVSKALSDSSEISKATKERVKDKAIEMHYRPNAIARGLVTKQTKTLGLIIPDITNPFFAEIAKSVEETANVEGFSVFLCNSNWDNNKEKEYINLLISKKVDGILLAPIGDGNLQMDNIELPVIIIGTRKQYNGRNFVVVDDKKGGYIATEHLIKNGNKKVMFIGGKENVQSNKERSDGYKTAMNDYGLAIDTGLIRNGNFKRESGYVLMKKALLDGIRPDSVFAGNDMLALGVIQAIYEFNLKIPEDIAIVGFDDIPFADLPEVSLTTVAQPKNKMGMLAVDLLLQKIKRPDDEASSIILIPQLIIRKTSLRI
jgi:LacI family transcriptional regulator